VARVLHLLTSWVLPDQIDRPDGMRRGKLLVAFLLLEFVLIFGAWALHLYRLEFEVATAVMLAATGTPIVVGLLRRTGSIRLGGHGAIAVWLGAVAVWTWSSGAVAGAIAFVALAILYAVLILGPMDALLWVVFSAVGLWALAGRLDPGGFRSFDSHLTPIITTVVLGVTWVLARFFDNLRIAAFEHTEKRNHDMEVVLGHVDQGLLTVDSVGVVQNERSRAVERLLGSVPTGVSLATVIGAFDSEAGEWISLAFEMVAEDVMPVEVSLAQLPKRFRVGERHCSLRVSAIGDDHFLVVVTDVTEEVARARAEQESRSMLVLFERMQRDRQEVVDFHAEANHLVHRILDLSCSESVRRDIHTLKGIMGMMGLNSVVQACHRVESAISERVDDAPTAAERREIESAWAVFRWHIDQWVGDDSAVVVRRQDVSRLLAGIRDGEDRSSLYQQIQSWEHMPLQTAMERLAKYATSLAERLGKRIHVDISTDGSRVDREATRDLFSALVHAVRNALDHGIDSPEERVARGMPEVAVLTLSAAIRDGALQVSVRDDGMGIDWNVLRRKARLMGLLAETEPQLVQLLLTRNVSSREEATELSGRGIGLCAIRAVAERMGGRVHLESYRGRGTLLGVEVPLRPPTARDKGRSKGIAVA